MKPEQQTPQQGYNNQLTAILFAVYAVALCWILLFKMGVQFSYMPHRLVNLFPFRELITGQGKVDYVEIILNIIIFIPLGIYAGLLFKKWRSAGHLLFFALTSLGFESLQFLLAIGSFDITDIITNTLGGIVGYLLYLAIQKAVGNSTKTHTFVNIAAATGTVIMVVLLLLLKMNMLPIRYQ